MILARLYVNHTDELRADIAQYYNLNIDDFDLDEDEPEPRKLHHIAVLAAQLPREARTTRKLYPATQWTDAEYLLHRIEHDIRAFNYAFTEDAKNKINKPEPLPTPLTINDKTTRYEREIEKRAEISKLLGLTAPDDEEGEQWQP